MSKRQAILFLIDTQGANCVGAYRPDLNLGTLNIDRLAAEGVRFDRAYTCSPVCGPARSALFTGLYPHSNGVIANDLAPHLDIPTLGQRLQAAGFATGYVGKWHLDGSDYFGDGRCPPGWDPAVWFDGRNYLESLPDETARRLSRQVLNASDVAAHGITSEFTHAHRIADRAIEFINRNREKDFLLVVSIDEPHHPAICPEPFVSAFEDFLFPIPNADDSLDKKPRAQQEWARHVAARYAHQLVQTAEGKALHFPQHFACNSYSDSQVGRVLQAIDTESPSSLVIYTADHGDMFGSHQLHGKGPCMYDEIARVPLIVRWPGHAPAAKASSGLVSHIDIVPTILAYFQMPQSGILQGRSLLRQIAEPDHVTNEQAFLEFNRFEVDHDGFGAFSPIRCVVDGRHKLVINLLDTDELYDLQEDPFELNNLIDKPERGAEREHLLRALIRHMNQTRDPLRGPHWIRRPWQRSIEQSTWGGPTRPRPDDEPWCPPALLYDTGEEASCSEYEKS
jgi:uncharacterized sulfatase